MGKQGRAIPSQGSQVKRKRPPLTEATRQKSENDKAKREWGKKECDKIFEALFQPDIQIDGQEDNITVDNDEMEHQPNQQILGGDDDDNVQVQAAPLTLTQLISGDSYKYRRIREDAQWRDVMQNVFVAFMQGSERTSNWGDDTLWCHDFNDDIDCSCSNALKRVRAVDTIDLIYRQKINVEFCSCVPDQVRLINLGYLGGSPKTPETAFSLRLLRFYHLSWEYCHSNIQPFSLMIDKYLDAFNPPILVPGTYEAMEELETRSLSLSPLAKLAANCPRCFGPAGTYGIQKGPQYIVCVDGNFQQRRHESASREIEEIPLSIPSIFMRPEDVARWEPKEGQNEVLLDPCTAQHTAAADRRNASSWKGCEETGLIALVCRHDHMLKMVNVIRWMVWNTHLPSLLRRTSHFSSEPPESVEILALNWGALIGRLMRIWESFVRGGWVVAQELDDLDLVEHNLLFGDDDMENYRIVHEEVVVEAGEIQ
ncbi:hypothetical protein DFH28DRAFT_1120323 [Melampsora americana]|nr:hypothetical protein DFH28DRAFT_1120323 [Melampsora americana]